MDGCNTPPRIRESSSKVAVNVHVVPKDAELGGPMQYRLVTNFKPVNDYFESDNHPVGDAQRIFDDIGGDTKAFWKVDFAQAFLQIPVAESSKYLTSFVTQEAQYEFNYVPFGLKSAPAKLQRELNKAFRGLERVYGFADDWLGAPTKEDQVIVGLRAFLNRVRASGFLLKPSKCCYLYDKLTYMGRELTLTGYDPDMESKQALLKLKRPAFVFAFPHQGNAAESPSARSQKQGEEKGCRSFHSSCGRRCTRRHMKQYTRRRWRLCHSHIYDDICANYN